MGSYSNILLYYNVRTDVIPPNIRTTPTQDDKHQEQIKMSGLEITTSSPLQWNSTNRWSPLGGRQREGQACVVVSSNDENDAAGAQTIVVVGGRTGRYATNATNSVVIWDPSIQNWRDGPNLNDRRWALVAVVCRDKVYAIGGSDENRALDTMESIQVSSLMDNNSEWTRLQCRLSSPRHGCAAVVVHNRYVVILGGRSGIGCHQWIFWIRHHPKTTTTMENQQ